MQSNVDLEHGGQGEPRGKLHVSEAGESSRPRFRKVTFLTLLAVYGPFLVGWLLMDCSDCRKRWGALLPILPGLAPELVGIEMAQAQIAQKPLRLWFGNGVAQTVRDMAHAIRRLPTWLHHIFQGTFTLGLIACVLMAAHKCSHWKLIGTACLFSSAFAVLTYMAFRA